MQPNVQTVLTEATRQLKTAGIDSARLDTLILLEDITGMGRAQLLAHPEHPLTAAQIGRLHTGLAKRALHTPLAYIRNKAYFYGREFYVNEHVLVPRPETETMIDILKKLPVVVPCIADIGTGSGCIAITAALELSEARVEAYDIDPHALAVARQNAAALHAPVSVMQSDLLAAVPEPVDIILANLPYVPDTLPINEAAAHEPALALFAGADGLDAYRRLFAQLTARTDHPQYIIAESLPMQHEHMRGIAQPAGYTERAVQGFIQLFELD